jgi:hypothetical protein
LRDDDCADRIDDAEKERMGRHRAEIVDAFDLTERILQVRDPDLRTTGRAWLVSKPTVASRWAMAVPP